MKLRKIVNADHDLPNNMRFLFRTGNSPKNPFFTSSFFSMKRFSIFIITLAASCSIVTFLRLFSVNFNSNLFSDDPLRTTSPNFGHGFTYELAKEHGYEYSATGRGQLNDRLAFAEMTVESFSSKPQAVRPYNFFKNNKFKDRIAQNIKFKHHIHSNEITRQEFDEWIEEQTAIALQNLQNNIADNNLNNNTLVYSSNGMIEGIVLASPSESDPNYFYDWTRDTAITMNTIINVLRVQTESEKTTSHLDGSKSAGIDIRLFGTVFKYMNKTYSTQRTENLSGDFLSDELKGLGEPKWEVNGNSFDGSWGRPQNDGPALRATTFMHFLKFLEDSDSSFSHIFPLLEPTLLNQTSLVFSNEKDFYDKILYYDLLFVIQNWNKQSFDLWEELNGNHFFTSMVQLNSLKLGIDLLTAKKWDSPDGVSNNDFIEQLKNTYHSALYFIKYQSGFQSGLKNHIVENPQFTNMRSGVDIATLIAAIITHDPISDDSASIVPYNFNNSYVLNTLHELTEQMSILYPINHMLKSPDLGVSLGRYPEDVYNGNGVSEGNPWFLATATGAQLIYGFVNLHLKNKMDLLIVACFGTWEQNFFSKFFTIQFTPNLVDEDYHLIIPYGSSLYIQTLNDMMNYADSFLDQVRQHVADEGNMSEQFNKYTGYQQGARDLTWSYGTFWNTAILRTKALQELEDISK